MSKPTIHRCESCDRPLCGSNAVVIILEDQADSGYTVVFDGARGLGFLPLSPAHQLSARIFEFIETQGGDLPIPFDAPQPKEKPDDVTP